MGKNTIQTTKYVLGITAHPDDHISYAGTVFKLKKQGYSYAEVVLSDAEESGMVKDGQRIVTVDKEEQLSVRGNEFDNAVELMGINPVFRLGLPNLGVEYTKENALTLLKIIREVRPEIALIHHPTDYMHDHIAASYLSLEALKISAYSFRLDLGANWRTPCVLYFEGVSPIDADVLVDITAEYDKKLELLKIYGSQFEDRSFRLTQGTALYRGYPRRTDYAEAFEIPKNYPLWGLEGGSVL